MPPLLALVLCYCFIGWLLRKDMQWRKVGAKGLLIPGIWLAIIGSRPVSEWFAYGRGETNLEGNPINTVLFAVLIGSALLILSRRGLDWGTFFRQNKILILIYLYFAIGMVWSDQPLVSFKRVFKDFGCVLVALIFLTEQKPAEAIRAVMVRISYILFPLSLVFGKYFPAIGRNYSVSGEPMFTGVTTQKNSLGQIVLVFGLILLWDLIELRKDPSSRDGSAKGQKWIHIGMLLLSAWLLIRCDSQTSLVCLILGLFVFWGSSRLLKMPNGKGILVSCLIAAILLRTLDQSLGMSDVLIRALGRNPSLTGRTDIWRAVLEQKTDPLVGDGFNIFWDTAKGYAAQTAVRARIQSSHNGYLEMYLDGGLFGIALLVLFLFAAGRRTINRAFAKVPLGQMGLVFWIAAIIYNLSESSFLRLDSLWLMLLLFTIEYPRKVFQAQSWVPQYETASLPAQFMHPSSIG
jgi:exopolysaccharide production protein ExoQ